jgi:polar amino acid transport system substrate-binding protein
MLGSLLLPILADNAAQAAALHLVTEDYPPYNMVDAKTRAITGISTDKVAEIMRRAGESYSLAAYPWSRAFHMGQSDADTCVFSTARTPQREKLFRWVGPLVSRYTWVIFGRADDSRRPQSLEELRPFVIGAYRKGAAAEFLAAKGFNTDLANYDSDNPRKLLYGRFDFWAAGKSHGQAILQNQGLSAQVLPLFEFHRGEMYLACQRSMDEERVERYNRILREMEKDGTAAAIERKYRRKPR